MNIVEYKYEVGDKFLINLSTHQVEVEIECVNIDITDEGITIIYFFDSGHYGTPESVIDKFLANGYYSFGN